MNQKYFMNASYYDDNTLITVGKHKGKRIREIPTDYLLAIHPNKNFPDKQLILYIENNLDRIKRIHNRTESFSSPPKNKECTKTRYITKAVAKTALENIQKSPGNHRKPTRYYLCDKCNFWHLSSHSFKQWKTKKQRRH